MAQRRALSRARVILPLALAAALAAQNRSAEEQGVLVAYRQMEEADRNGRRSYTTHSREGERRPSCACRQSDRLRSRNHSVRHSSVQGRGPGTAAFEDHLF
jgi:hypothetical protein